MRDVMLIEALNEADHPWVEQFTRKHWGSPIVITRGRALTVDTLPGFAAYIDGECVGLVTYHIEGNTWEIASINSLHPNRGIGTALLAAVIAQARTNGCRRLWLITTNDNTHALRFYQKGGWHLVAIHCNAIEQSRRLKPEIPLFGNDGIPIRDEIELEFPLGAP